MDAKTQEAIDRCKEYTHKRYSEMMDVIKRCEEMYAALEKIASVDPSEHRDFPDSSAWEDNLAFARNIAHNALNRYRGDNVMHDESPASASTDSAEADTESEVS